MHMFGHSAKKGYPEIYLIANAHWENASFQLPILNQQKWYRFIDTSLPDDLAIMDDDKLQIIDDQHYLVEGRTVVVLITILKWED